MLTKRLHGFILGHATHLASALTARLVTRKRTKVKSTVHAEHRLSVSRLGVERDSSSEGGRGELLRVDLDGLGQLEGRGLAQREHKGDES